LVAVVKFVDKIGSKIVFIKVPDLFFFGKQFDVDIGK